jgi:hypothetical protein
MLFSGMFTELFLVVFTLLCLSINILGYQEALKRLKEALFNNNYTWLSRSSNETQGGFV